MRNLRCRRFECRRFSLIELMVVVVILGILAGVIAPRILNRPEQARRTAAQADIRSLETALALFKADTGRYPTTAEGLQALVRDPGVRGWKAGGYLSAGNVPKDPWGNDYVYLSPGTDGRDYDLLSYGKDGTRGGTGDDADIESWNLRGEN